MTKEEIFNAWAPEGVEWSAWAKPVLFAQWPDTVTPPATTPEWDEPDYLWLPQAAGRTAIVVDLPAVESVRTGISFARRGYRPVPLFNTSHGPSPVIEIAPLVLELGRGARLLQTIAMGIGAPPVFLIDSARMQPALPPSAGKFCSAAFPSNAMSAATANTRKRIIRALAPDPCRSREVQRVKHICGNGETVSVLDPQSTARRE